MSLVFSCHGNEYIPRMSLYYIRALVGFEPQTPGLGDMCATIWPKESSTATLTVLISQQGGVRSGWLLTNMACLEGTTCRTSSISVQTSQDVFIPKPSVRDSMQDPDTEIHLEISNQYSRFSGDKGLRRGGATMGKQKITQREEKRGKRHMNREDTENKRKQRAHPRSKKGN